MKHFSVAAALILLCLAACTQNRRTIEFANGNWYGDGGFHSGTFYSVDGVLTRERPGRLDTTINLEGRFVVPPLADAHTHNLDGGSGLQQMVDRYLEEGTFYVQVLTNHASASDTLRDRFRPDSTLDVAYANGGLTSTGGHPFATYEARALGLSWRAMIDQPDTLRNSRLEAGDAYWLLDSREEVEEKWEEILATRPHLIKIYLLNSGNHEELSANAQLGDTGLSPDVAALVVEKAHRAGLKVHAHIETADDFRTGLDIGVDGFAHMPGYSWRGRGDGREYRLTDGDLERAAGQQVTVIPTVSFARTYATRYGADGSVTVDTAQMETVNGFMREELVRFREKGVRLAIGSDYNGATVSRELDYLHEQIRAFDNETLLNIAVRETVQSIYPDRRVGVLEDGYEASFLVLEGNPVRDFSALKRIALRVKEGHLLD